MGKSNITKQILQASNAAGLELMVNFQLTDPVRPNTPYGNFGALTAMNQSPTAAPKYRALFEAVSGLLYPKGTSTPTITGTGSGSDAGSTGTVPPTVAPGLTGSTQGSTSPAGGSTTSPKVSLTPAASPTKSRVKVGVKAPQGAGNLLKPHKGQTTALPGVHRRKKA